jgi:hypothetical protein
MNDFGLSFDPLLSWIVILILVLPVFAFSIWKEFRGNKRFRFFRLICLAIVLISILGILLRPFYSSKKEIAGSILLTPGFDPNKVDSLRRQNPKLEVIRTKDAETFPSSDELSSFQEFHSKSIKYILGEGLPQYASNSLKGYHFFPAKMPNGIIELNMPEDIYESRRNSIHGVFNSPSNTILKLISPLGLEDSINFSKGTHSFDFSFQPKEAGLFVYKIQWQDADGNSSSENLPIEVKDEKKLKVLIVQKFPSAEMKYLKNFLAEKGHSVAMRSQTSKTNFNSEFVNMPQKDVSRFTPEMLRNFDLVILDAGSIKGLTEADKSIFKKAVSEGLGVILTEIDTKTTGVFHIEGKPILKDSAKVKLGKNSYSLTTEQIEVATHSFIKPLIKNKTRILAGYLLVGAGKIGFQMLQETYKIASQGNHDDYASIWSTLVEKIARSQENNSAISLTSAFPYYVDEPLDFTVIASENHLKAESDGERVPLTEDVLIDDYWHGRAWAGNAGWHQFTTNDSAIFNFFVSTSDEWKSLRIANQLASTRMNQSESEPGKVLSTSVKKEIPSLMFFLAFILASGFLWLEPKI